MGTFGTIAFFSILSVGLFYFLVKDRLRFTWQWEADWEGHRILVRWWSNPLLQEGEELVIDGVPVLKTRLTRPQVREDLYGEIQTNGKVRRVHAHVGYTDESFKMGCLISVDGVPVGGDVGKRFYT